MTKGLSKARFSKSKRTDFGQGFGSPSQLLCYVIAAKRYVLFTIDDQGKVKISDQDDENYSRHGLGHLLDPLDPELTKQVWIRQFWEMIIAEALGRRVRRPEWLKLPAVSRITATTPELVLRLQSARKPKTYAAAIKPMNFLITAHVQAFQVPAEAQATRFQLIAPYTRDPRKWASMTWTDYYSGKSYAITTSGDTSGRVVRVKSYGDVFEEYQNHPEPKSQGPDGEPCGPASSGELARRPVYGLYTKYIGKESNHLEEVEQELVHDWEEVRCEYYDPQADPWRTIVVPILQTMNRSEVASLAGISERHVTRLRNLKEMPSPERQHRLTQIAGDHARGRIGDERQKDDLEACASYSGFCRPRG